MIQEFKLKTFGLLMANIHLIEEYIENNASQLNTLTGIYNQLPENINSSHFLLIPYIKQDIETEEEIVNELLYYDHLLKNAIMEIDQAKNLPLIPDFKEIYTLSEELINKIKIGLENAYAKIRLLQSCMESIYTCKNMDNLYSTTYN